MDDNKKQLLSELYCLRAGISAISLESKRLKSEDDRVKGVNVRIEDNIAEIINYNSIVTTSKKTLKSAKHDYQSAKRKYDKKSFPLWVHSIITVCLLAIAGYVWYLRAPEGKFVFLYDVLIGGILVVAAIELFRSLLISRKLKPLRVQMKRAKQLMLDSKTWIEESEKGAKTVDEENKSLKEQKSEYGLSRSDAASLSVAIAEALYAALASNFSGIVGRSYYSALDVVIDLIRSDKCDNVTAALLAVDSKKTAGGLEEAAFTSHQRLLSYIDDDITELSEELNGSYEKLSKALVIENERAAQKLKKDKAYVSAGIAEATGAISKANSKEALQYAIEAQKLKSCYDMAVDLDYILSADEKVIK